MNEIRRKAVDFSTPYLLEETTFVTPMPGNIKSNLALLQVFDGTTYSVTLLSRIIQPTKVAPIRTFHELSRAVQSGDHKLYTKELYIQLLLDSGEDHLKALGRMIVHNNWMVSLKKYQDISYGSPKSSQIRTRNYALLRFGHDENVFILKIHLMYFPWRLRIAKTSVVHQN
ncbi:hypothetical protein CEXT_65871 [Caerostris extrusa]|uniref:Uncharacterized protein n=1 Tax=Caerostris extrusa TaxID=172846 RepID=A0AAV4TDA5_CAEEX|nr:hypothetical protein CEXT_65871 [Caerostris extrusa]